MTRPYTIHVVRRPHGIPVDAYIATCPNCRWRQECRELHTASVLNRLHQCEGDAA